MLNINDIITLVPEDWHFEMKSHKGEAQQVGLALDLHVKRLAMLHDLRVSSQVFGPWDWALDETTLVDTKSSSRGTVTVSAQEADFTIQHLKNGGTMLHAVFYQNGDDTLTFKGFVDYADMLKHNKLHQSKLSKGGYYYAISSIKDLLC